MQTFIIVGVSLITAVVAIENFLFYRSSVSFLPSSSSKVPLPKKSPVLLGLAILFALPFFIPLEHITSESETIRIFCLPIAAILAILYYVRLIRVYKGIGMTEYSQRLRRQTIGFAIFIGVCSFILVAVFIGSKLV